MDYHVYKITNKLNNKFYYGVTNYWKRRKYQYDRAPVNTASAMVAAIRKHGWGNLDVTVIKDNLTKAQAYTLEKSIVTQDLVNNPMCYNLTTGGCGGSQKGRKGNRLGCSPSNKLLDENTDQEIRELYATGLYTQWGLAKKYGLKSRTAITGALKGINHGKKK